MWKTKKELLWEHSAAPSDSWFNGNKANAIERLAMVDESAAYAIACQELTGDHGLAHRMPSVLLELRPNEGIEELFRFASSSTDKGILRSIGLALRRHGDTSQVRSRMAESLEDATWKHRRSLGFIAGYLGAPSTCQLLANLAFGDSNPAVFANRNIFNSHAPKI